jgi:gamma-glutamyltranspeptidase/glutathione hydrolase/leukotriene-C4 hydrolase
LEEGGSVVDAAIAALLCNGLANAHSMGIGGGFVMTIWDATEKKPHALIAREWAPSAASENMFGGNRKLSVSGKIFRFSEKRF